jgi:hypothetical protein
MRTLAALLLSLTLGTVAAHPGSTDQNGCHRDPAGNRHCH